MKYFLLATLTLFVCQTKAQYHYYFGNLHAHSSYSDGNKDAVTTGFSIPGDNYNYAKGSYHMDFLGIAEHNHYSANNNPGMHVADYAKGLYQADTANRDGVFVTMYGMEYGVISGGGHVITYGVPGLIGWETGSGNWGPTDNYDIFCAKSDYTSFWPIINSYPNAFCTLAHPEIGDYEDIMGSGAFNGFADSAIVGMAVRSGAAFSTTTDYSDAAPSIYEIRFRNALARGYHVAPAEDHDNHYTTFGRTSHTRTVVLATELKRDSIIAAYKAMRFYASDDWNAEVTFTVNGNVMGSVFSTNGNSSIAVSINDPSNNNGDPDPITRIQLYYGVPGSGTNSTVLSTVNGSTSMNFTHTTSLGNVFYYYAKITQVDGDIIWTAPIWVTRTSTTLPVELTSLARVQRNNQIDLSWTTAQELNNDRFEIERSADGVTFTAVGTVPSRNHNSTTVTSYQFNDLTPARGMNFYRLKQIDIDGRSNYSNTIAINFNKAIISLIRLNPNPAVSYINLNCFSEVNETITYKIYNSEGRQIIAGTKTFYSGNNNFNTDISRLASGQYYFVLSRKNERIGEATFIKR